MSQVIMTNVASLNSQRQLNKSQASLNQSLERLSSGLRINSAKDDAAGLAISARMTSQITGMNVAVRNANDGISLAQTAEGTLSSISDNLQRMRELAVQSANASNSTTDRVAIQQEVTQLSAEIDRVAAQTDFNGTKLLDGSFNNMTFQVGANVGQTITVDSIDNARASVLGKFTGFQLQNQSIGAANDTAAAQTITVGGVPTSLGSIKNDAKALATAINASGISGLSATADATTRAGVAVVTGTSAAGTATFSLNGINIGVAVTTAALGGGTSNVANALAAINAQSSATGVVASSDSNGLKLTAVDGRNITTGASITLTGGAAGTTFADFGLNLTDATSYGATIDITYQAARGVSGTMTFGGAFDPGAQTIGSTGTAINAIDVTTQNNANIAIASIDVALASVNSSKANLGAIQNRFTSVVANLQSSSENLSASRSRIQDADFAAETAAMSKANILQQAGTAMLAQANSAPQNVLSLLK